MRLQTLRLSMVIPMMLRTDGVAKQDMPAFGHRSSITRRTDSGEIGVSTEFLRDSAIAVENEVANQALERIYRQLNRIHVLGTGDGHATRGAGSVGANRFYGLQVSANAEASPATGGALVLADLENFVSKVDFDYLMPPDGEVFQANSYNGVGYMLHSSAFLKVLYMVDDQKRPLFTYDSLGIGRIDKNFPVSVNNAFAPIGTANNVFGVFGNLSGYTVRERQRNTSEHLRSSY